jgi:predicted aspartyl protease
MCGVDIEKYARKKRKRQHKLFAILAVMGIGVVFTATYVSYTTRDREAPQEARRYGYYETEAKGKGIPTGRAKEFGSSTGRQLYSTKKPDRRTPAGLRKATSRPGRSDDEGPQRTERGAGSLADEQTAKLTPKKPGGTLTAKQWFEKGTALDDDSEAEMEFYQKAMELDPEFAPAHYRLGAIYYRQASYELADEQFAKFLKYASEPDREAYDIYVYYSLGDVERLSAERTEGQDLAEEVEKETPEEAEEETEGEAVEEPGEEVNTIVRFSSIDGHVVVPVVLNGLLQARVLVDTGAGITVISRDLAHNLRLEGEPGDSVTLKTMAMDIQAQLARLDSIQVGGLSRRNFPVAITDLPFGEKGKFDGILGMDFMNNYKIQIDNENKRIVFTPTSG